MGVLKLNVIDEQIKEEKKSIKKFIKTETPNHIGACDCPCWAFVHNEGSIVNDIKGTASWNID